MRRERASTLPASKDVVRYQGRLLARPEEELVDQGLAFDLETLLDRRGLLRAAASAGLGCVGLFALAACGGSPASEPATQAAATVATTSDGNAATGTCTVIPEETAGPYPADGSNGPDVLGESGIVRADIRSSFGEYTGSAEGVPLSVRLLLQDASNGCSALPGAAVYLWHCDREGGYSIYTVTDRNYLRGVQEAGSDGVVTFESIFPGCYSGRWPHIHFEVYSSLADATDDANIVVTSQIALPQGACEEVYATPGYEQSVANLAQISLDSDNVFGDDGGASQLGAVTGSVDEEFVVELTVPVAATR